MEEGQDREIRGSFSISVIGEGGEFIHVNVPESIYYYIKQLEGYIKHPESSKLKEVYHERF